MMPREATIAVTYRCNARCAMCNIWRVSEYTELSPYQYRKLPRSLRTINITGGEPFLRTDLVDVVKVISERCRDARIVFSSNGYMTNRILSEMKTIRDIHRNIGVGISIDGIGEVHDRIRGLEGTYVNALKTIDGLRAQGVTDLRIGMTILPENIEEVAKVFRLSQEIGLEFTTTIAHNSGVYFKKTDNKSIADAEGLEGSLRPVVNSLLESRRVKDLFRAYHTAGLIDASIRTQFYSLCEAGESFFFMAPNGDIYPCLIIDHCVGNISGIGDWRDLSDSFSNPRLKSIVKTCRRDCWMVCNTRSLIRAHPFKAGFWVLTRKMQGGY